LFLVLQFEFFEHAFDFMVEVVDASLPFEGEKIHLSHVGLF
jgi:hypothetical protein